MGEETLMHHNSLVAPLIFFIVIFFQLISRYIEYLKKRGHKSSMEIQLHSEIKQLLKEANGLSQPSTFAQAAKLKRLAAAKEKELQKCLQSKEKSMPYDFYGKVLAAVKVSTYIVLVFWYWGVPVTIISKQLVQPFGNVLSWRAGGTLNDRVMVGIVPWLIVSARVSRFVCRKFIK